MPGNQGTHSLPTNQAQLSGQMLGDGMGEGGQSSLFGSKIGIVRSDPSVGSSE